MDEPKSPQHRRTYEAWKKIRAVEGAVEFKAPNVLEREKEFGPTLYFIRNAHGGVMPNSYDKSTGFPAADLAAGHLLAVNEFRPEDLERGEPPESLTLLVRKLSSLVPELVVPGEMEDADNYGEMKAEADHMTSITHEKDVLHNAVGRLYLVVIENWKNGRGAKELLKTYHDYMKSQK